MKFSTTVLAAVYVVSVSSIPVRRDVDPTLVPDLGATAGKNPTGTGDCDGAVNGPDGKPIKVPCTCPPDRQTFLAALNANVAAGHAVNNPTIQVSFPTDGSKASVDARFNAFAVTIQNLNGPGKGCPIVSTTLQAQQKAADSAPLARRLNFGFAGPIFSFVPKLPDGSSTGPAPPPDPITITGSAAPLHQPQRTGPATLNTPLTTGPAPSDAPEPSPILSFVPTKLPDAISTGPAPPPDPITTTGSAAPSDAPLTTGPAPSDTPLTSNAPSPTNAAPSSATPGVDPNLVPILGGTAGKNPTGTGDCDGAVNGPDGKPIKVPCTCPPAQQAFLAALNENVAAGHAVHNPSINVSFPADNSTASQAARIQAAIVTLQNLNGPGEGCPVASTTLLAQEKALQAPASPS